LWIDASELPAGFHIYVIDVGAGQAGFYGVMKERDKPLIIALANPRPEYVTTLPRPAACHNSRWSTSPTVISKRSSMPTGSSAPFADDCVRRENGGQTPHNAKPVPWPVPRPQELLRAALQRLTQYVHVRSWSQWTSLRLSSLQVNVLQFLSAHP
jgi:hypothetical protein